MAAQPKPLHLEQANYLEGGGIYSWLTTIDHKRIAVLYGVTAMLFMVLGGTEAMLVRAQLIVPNNTFPLGRLLQPDVHDARLDDDLPRRHAVGDRPVSATSSFRSRSARATSRSRASTR